MTNSKCLNCDKELVDTFCSSCGQKADTHRITIKNFISHDVIHGLFHLEKGILFTSKEALLRPGKAAVDYISGKRKRYYNVFYLILITFGLIVFFRHFYVELSNTLATEPIQERTYINEASKRYAELFSQKSKIIIFLFVPLFALNSYIFFRRKKLNLAEHSIIAGMILLGTLLISLFGNLFFYFSLLIEFNDTFADMSSLLVVILIAILLLYGYYNAFAADYSKFGITYRLILFLALIALEIVIMLYILIGFITDWKFGTISINPL
jgi:hypothetical protein